MATAITTATLAPTTRQQPDSPRAMQRKRQMRKSIKIKPSHAGMLHEDAGKPQGENSRWRNCSG